jgi:hypothetical protein
MMSRIRIYNGISDSASDPQPCIGWYTIPTENKLKVPIMQRTISTEQLLLWQFKYRYGTHGSTPKETKSKKLISDFKKT